MCFENGHEQLAKMLAAITNLARLEEVGGTSIFRLSSHLKGLC